MSTHKTVVIDVVALTKDLITPETTPFLHSYFQSTGKQVLQDIKPAFPAVTCSAQTTYLTGKTPSEHGIVGNMWYDRAYCENRNWHQSAKLVNAPRIFEALKKQDPSATTFSNCFWFPMYDDYLDFVVTPRPQYLADGGKAADIWTKPASLRESLQQQLGAFPLQNFWGPGAGIASTAWIADASILVDKAHNPTLSVIYLPHLDYIMQKVGPHHPDVVHELHEVDREVQKLVSYYTAADSDTRIIVLSEYGINPVSRPVHINRVLREHGQIAVRSENGGETLDCGASKAFAIPDHQVAHVYVNHGGDIAHVQKLLQSVPGVQHVLSQQQLDSQHYAPLRAAVANFSKSRGAAYHRERMGDLIVVSELDAWFTYYYWLDDRQAPDFARTINIHRKPGYDPVEMYYAYDNDLLGKVWLFWKLFLVYVLRIRTTVDGTGFNADRIRGSHGKVDIGRKYWPVLGSLRTDLSASDASDGAMYAEAVYDVIWRHLTQK
ncbi:hypothetical protein RI367_007373 [Sorochytrium milnesiophthora]